LLRYVFSASHRISGDQRRLAGMGSPRREGTRHGQCGSLDAAGLLLEPHRPGDLSARPSARRFSAMSQLQQQTPASKREVPTLRNRLLRPEPWLAAILLLAILFAADAMRPPQSQVSVRLFAASADGYHRYL